MLDHYFSPKVLPLLKRGPLASHLRGFCGWLRAQGYSRVTIRRYLSQASHFSRWLESEGMGIGRRLREAAAAFRSRHLPVCRCELVGLRHDKSYGSLERLLEYLTQVGLKLDPKPPRVRDLPLIEDHIEYLKHCGLAAGTIRLRRWNLRQFMQWLGPDAAPGRLHRLTPDRIEDFCLWFGQDRGRSQRHAMQTTLRTFLAYCLKQGLMSRDLRGAVPVLLTYSLASVPRAIGDEDARRVLSGIDTSQPEGLRDRAILQLLFSYGVRGVQVCALKLEDILWESSRIRFAPVKGGRELELPLTEAAGNWLLAYLRKSRRPSAARREVFLATRAPYGPVRRNTLGRIVARRVQEAGIEAPLRVHSFRHGFASRMLRQGQSLKAVADLLGHRALQSTFIYTKIDLRTLSEVALPWPEASS